MELERKDVAKVLEFIRTEMSKNNEIRKIIDVDMDYTGDELIYGVSNDFLSDFISVIIGTEIRVVGKVEKLFKCPCCGYRTLTEKYSIKEGTGYSVCKFCNWEDDGTNDINIYRSINGGSISDYQKIISKKRTNRWEK